MAAATNTKSEKRTFTLKERQRKWDELLKWKDDCASEYSTHSLQDDPLEETVSTFIQNF